MAEQQRSRKRSWGKARHKEDITIINREKIEETLQTIAEEKKKAEVLPPANHKTGGEGGGGGDQSTGLDLQYPELMSNESLVAALRRIKVPIPVYPDGNPSRERLLYLYKTNVLPRPQRNRSRGSRGQRRGQKVEQGEQGVTEMDIDQTDDWAMNSDGSLDLNLQRKRKLTQSDATPTELLSPAKKLTLDSSVVAGTTPLGNPTTTPPATGSSPSPLVASTTPPSAPASQQQQRNSAHKIVRLKRVPPGHVAMSTTSSSSSSSSAMLHSSGGSLRTSQQQRQQLVDTSKQPNNVAKKRDKITWP